MSLKESNVTGVIFDLFFTIKTRPASGWKVGVGSGWWMGVSKRVKCDTPEKHGILRNTRKERDTSN